MATFAGKYGKVSFSADLFEIRNWTLTVTGDVAEDSAMQDDWASYLAGLTDFTASAEGNAETTIDYAALLGTGATLALYVDNTHHIDGTAILTGANETADVNSVGRITYAFEGNDADSVIYA